MQLCDATRLYAEWLDTTRDLSPHTVRAYHADVSALARYLGPQVDVADIASASLVEFLVEQRSAGLAGRSIRRHAAGLRSFTRWLLDCDLVATDPSEGAKVRVGHVSSLPRAISADDLDRLLRSLCTAAQVSRDTVPDGVLARPHESTTLLAAAVMVSVGLRVCEVVGVRCFDVDASAQSIRVLGKGRRERVVFVTNEWLTGLTRAYLATRAELCIRHDSLLFGRKESALSTASMRSRLAKAGVAAGLSVHVTPHMLRHTAATQLIESGVDIRYVQRLLGHASLTTTAIYTHVADHALRRVVSEADVLGKSLAR